jgi:hypothetical protein
VYAMCCAGLVQGLDGRYPLGTLSSWAFVICGSSLSLCLWISIVVGVQRTPVGIFLGAATWEGREPLARINRAARLLRAGKACSSLIVQPVESWNQVVQALLACHLPHRRDV